jgi:hypothetical protein
LLLPPHTHTHIIKKYKNTKGQTWRKPKCLPKIGGGGPRWQEKLEE